ncbi:uncharacterized protein MONBRDRAFT_38964 [Monosiga brevicollis MX1]|uniref:DNA polymerase eta n=1 Tax=Monosiga brevicollis TaxID=81824 RepID=A9VB80_MONBE|nr:uncharacterized protein MONBRDRAFT_38964 [Monosiga brevicollis MX1]EDQ85140.1 predicted protein [Monosiga brevicollis MX1]|eukprot:XP_001749965.1 hypothetical protein [Monosiga brevicollis MX1]
MAKPRVIIHADLDAFYTQVERQRHPELKDRPLAVQQWSGLIAIDYKCKAAGIGRHSTVEEARKILPDLACVHVDVINQKASLEPYRQASRDIMAVMEQYGTFERASIDEAYFDVTQEAQQREAQTPATQLCRHYADLTLLQRGAVELRADLTLEDWLRVAMASTHVMGYAPDDGPDDHLGFGWLPKSEEDALLFHGAMIAAEIRFRVFEETGYVCSAGIAHNKLFAKMGSGFNKPSQQTLYPRASSGDQQYRQAGERLLVADCLGLSLAELRTEFSSETAAWLHGLLRGHDSRAVASKGPPRSLLEAKSITGQATQLIVVEYWINNLCHGLARRILDDARRHNRWPKNYVLQFKRRADRTYFGASRSCGPVPHITRDMVRHAQANPEEGRVQADITEGRELSGVAAGARKDVPLTPEEQALAVALRRGAMVVFQREVGSANFSVNRFALSATFDVSATAKAVQSGKQHQLSAFFGAATRSSSTMGPNQDDRGAAQEGEGDGAIESDGVSKVNVLDDPSEDERDDDEAGSNGRQELPDSRASVSSHAARAADTQEDAKPPNQESACCEPARELTSPPLFAQRAFAPSARELVHTVAREHRSSPPLLSTPPTLAAASATTPAAANNLGLTVSAPNFVCPMCPQGFSTLEALSRHVNHHLDEQEADDQAQGSIANEHRGSEQAPPALASARSPHKSARRKKPKQQSQAAKKRPKVMSIDRFFKKA